MREDTGVVLLPMLRLGKEVWLSDGCSRNVSHSSNNKSTSQVSLIKSNAFSMWLKFYFSKGKNKLKSVFIENALKIPINTDLLYFWNFIS